MTGSRLSLALSLAALACGEPAFEQQATREPAPEESLPGGATTNTLLGGANAFTMPAANISAEHEALFFAGNGFFSQPWVQAPSSTAARDGLGPLFNARACAACHFKDGRGRPPLEADEDFLGMLLRIGVPGLLESGEPLPDPTYGGQLQPFSLADVPVEGAPHVTYAEVPGEFTDGEPYTLLDPEYTIEDLAYGPVDADLRISPRVAPAVIGLGLLEAIPIERLEQLSDPDDADGDGISGRMNRVWDATLGEHVPGRFGWKAEQPSVRQQSAGAFLGDMGLTSELFPTADCTAAEPECAVTTNGGEPEVETDMLDRVATYGRLLAVPARTGYREPEVVQGKDLFTQAGCDGCHVARHETSEVSDLEELSAQVIWPYTDLLLHDMGEDLSDERPSFEATGPEWRTPPLWGVGRIPDVNGHDRLLHDGRARGVTEAILWHGGEGEPAREAFRNLSATDRQALVRFVESL